ncbi:KEOPS complex subunit Pcc1 [Caldisphaera sp.]|uniref:KEOPS complex subunit Pcc1 n=1 Tax=Caldisphaera sp. TaxID=2060322 RepID=UPI0025BD1FB2|nr:KEOPS complex subunit Pcc1 [Caldisphaera sp.]
MGEDSLDCTATLILSSKDADVLAKSLKPDNIKNIPNYLSIDCKSDNGKLICTIKILDCTDPKKIMSLKNTIDDLLINIKSVVDSI